MWQQSQARNNQRNNLYANIVNTNGQLENTENENGNGNRKEEKVVKFVFGIGREHHNLEMVDSAYTTVVQNQQWKVTGSHECMAQNCQWKNRQNYY